MKYEVNVTTTIIDKGEIVMTKIMTIISAVALCVSSSAIAADSDHFGSGGNKVNKNQVTYSVGGPSFGNPNGTRKPVTPTVGNAGSFGSSRD